MKALALLVALASLVVSFFAVAFMINYMGVSWTATSWVVTIPGVASINLSPAWTVFPIFLAGWFITFLFGCGAGSILRGKLKYTSEALSKK